MTYTPANTRNFVPSSRGDALPRFGLEVIDAIEEDDAAVTSEQQRMTAARARKVVRKKAVVLAPDSTAEIEADQILIETYLEDAQAAAKPRPSPTILPPAMEAKKPASNAAIPIALADDDGEDLVSAIDDIDRFLRQTSPKAPSTGADRPVSIDAPPRPPPRAPEAIAAFHVPGLKTPPAWQRLSWHPQDPPSHHDDAAPLSVAPVAMPSMPSMAEAFTPPRPQRSRVGLMVTCALLACGLLAGASVPFLLPPGTVAKLASSVRGNTPAPNANGGDATPQAPKPQEPAPIRAAVESPVVAPAAPVTKPMPSVSVNALPKTKVEPKLTLVTLPPRAKGHRVWVDRFAFSGSVSPVKMACGKHVVKVGSRGTPVAMDFPCGGEAEVR